MDNLAAVAARTATCKKSSEARRKRAATDRVSAEKEAAIRRWYRWSKRVEALPDGSYTYHKLNLRKLKFHNTRKHLERAIFDDGEYKETMDHVVMEVRRWETEYRGQKELLEREAAKYNSKLPRQLCRFLFDGNREVAREYRVREADAANARKKYGIPTPLEYALAPYQLLRKRIVRLPKSERKSSLLHHINKILEMIRASWGRDSSTDYLTMDIYDRVRNAELEAIRQRESEVDWEGLPYRTQSDSQIADMLGPGDNGYFVRWTKVLMERRRRGYSLPSRPPSRCPACGRMYENKYQRKTCLGHECKLAWNAVRNLAKEYEKGGYGDREALLENDEFIRVTVQNYKLRRETQDVISKQA